MIFPDDELYRTIIIVVALIMLTIVLTSITGVFKAQSEAQVQVEKYKMERLIIIEGYKTNTEPLNEHYKKIMKKITNPN